MAETGVMTLRFAKQKYAKTWSQDRRIKTVREAVSISEPYHEDRIWYAPWAIDVKVPIKDITCLNVTKPRTQALPSSID